MASKAELLASARKKRDPDKIFRRGRGTTTSVRQPAVNRDAGREAKAVSDFLGTMLKFGPGVLDAHNRETNEENKKLVAKGEATYKNATPDQRKQFRDNVRNGTISGGESPYFREGLRRSHADAEALEYGNSVMLAWESSEAKNSADPEAFNNFLDEFQNKAEGPPGMNRSWKERIGDLGDHVANEEFWPKADAIKRQLSQMHSQHQRTEYNKKAKATKEASERVKYDNGLLETSMSTDSLEAVLLDEYVQDEHLSTHINVLKDSKNRLSKKGNLKSQFITNALSNGMNKKDALVAWNTKKNGLNVSVNNLSLETVGQPSESVFTIAAFNKEAKETQKDQSAYQVAMQKIKNKGKKIIADFPILPHMPVGSMRPEKDLSFKAVADLGFTPSLVEEADEEEVGLAEFAAPLPIDPRDELTWKSHTLDQGSQLPFVHNPDDSLGPLGQGQNRNKVVAMTDAEKLHGAQNKIYGEGKEAGVKRTRRGYSQIAVLDEETQAAFAGAPYYKNQREVDIEIALARGEPADQSAPEQVEASVVQPMTQQKVAESVQTAMMKAIGGIEPGRNSYGLVAYKTEDEAQRMVDKIRDGVVGDTTGDWEFVINKVGKVYQVQTQGGATITDKHKAAFFDKLASEYPGEMGNLEAGAKDKDFVQRIPAKKYKKKGT